MTITAGFSFSDIVARANDAVFVAEVGATPSSSSTIVYVNDAFCRLSGYGEDQAVGKPSSFQDGEDTDDDTRAKIEEALKAGRHIRTRLLQYAKDGTAYWVDMNIMPLLGEDGSMTHFAAIERDVTENVEREAELLSLATTPHSHLMLCSFLPLSLPLSRSSLFFIVVCRRSWRKRRG